MEHKNFDYKNKGKNNCRFSNRNKSDCYLVQTIEQRDAKMHMMQ